MFYIRQRRKAACLCLSEFICHEFNLHSKGKKGRGVEKRGVTVGRCFSIELNAGCVMWEADRADKQSD